MESMIERGYPPLITKRKVFIPLLVKEGLGEIYLYPSLAKERLGKIKNPLELQALALADDARCDTH